MFLAFREILRAKTRFGLLMAAVALLVFLILTQQALQAGLITSFVGAIERQSAPVLVYSVDGQRTLQGSVITPALEARVEAVPGVAASGDIGQATFTVTVDGEQPSDAALIGYERADLGAPDALTSGRLPRAAGEAVGSAGAPSLGGRVGGPGARGGSARRRGRGTRSPHGTASNGTVCGGRARPVREPAREEPRVGGRRGDRDRSESVGRGGAA